MFVVARCAVVIAAIYALSPERSRLALRPSLDAGETATAERLARLWSSLPDGPARRAAEAAAQDAARRLAAEALRVGEQPPVRAAKP